MTEQETRLIDDVCRACNPQKKPKRKNNHSGKKQSDRVHDAVIDLVQEGYGRSEIEANLGDLMTPKTIKYLEANARQ